MPKTTPKVKPALTGYRLFTVRLFQVTPRHLRRQDPIPLTPMQVRARSGDEARRVVMQELRDAGRVVRSLSSSQTPDTLLAYLAPDPASPAALRSPPTR